MKTEVLHGPRYPSHLILFPSMGIIEEWAWSMRRELGWRLYGQTPAVPHAARLPAFVLPAAAGRGVREKDPAWHAAELILPTELLFSSEAAGSEPAGGW